MKRKQPGNFSCHSDLCWFPSCTHIFIYLCVYTSTPSEFPATPKHCRGHGNGARAVEWIDLWRSCLCVSIWPSCTSHKHLEQSPAPSWTPSFPSVPPPGLTQGSHPSIPKQILGLPRCDSSTVEIPYFLNVLFFFWCLFCPLQVPCVPLRGSRNVPAQFIPSFPSLLWALVLCSLICSPLILLFVCILLTIDV